MRTQKPAKGIRLSILTMFCTVCIFFWQNRIYFVFFVVVTATPDTFFICTFRLSLTIIYQNVKRITDIKNYLSLEIHLVSYLKSHDSDNSQGLLNWRCNSPWSTWKGISLLVCGRSRWFDINRSFLSFTVTSTWKLSARYRLWYQECKTYNLNSRPCGSFTSCQWSKEEIECQDLFSLDWGKISGPEPTIPGSSFCTRNGEKIREAWSPNGGR